jgi:uncharacterized membrane protein YqjE
MAELSEEEKSDVFDLILFQMCMIFMSIASSLSVLMYLIISDMGFEWIAPVFRGLLSIICALLITMCIVKFYSSWKRNDAPSVGTIISQVFGHKQKKE